MAQTTQNIWNLIVGKSSLQEMANFGDYPWDFEWLKTSLKRRRMNIKDEY